MINSGIVDHLKTGFSLKYLRNQRLQNMTFLFCIIILFFKHVFFHSAALGPQSIHAIPWRVPVKDCLITSSNSDSRFCKFLLCHAGAVSNLYRFFTNHYFPPPLIVSRFGKSVPFQLIFNARATIEVALATPASTSAPLALVSFET